MRTQILDLDRQSSGLTQEEFDRWRSFWLANHDPFQQDLTRTLSNEMFNWLQESSVRRARDFLRTIVSRVNVDSFVRDTVYPHEVGIGGATWNVGQVNALLGRYQAELKSAEANLPNPVIEWLEAAGRSIDRGTVWIEARPRTLTVVGLLVLALAVWQAPAFVHELTEFVRAFRGG